MFPGAAGFVARAGVVWTVEAAAAAAAVAAAAAAAAECMQHTHAEVTIEVSRYSFSEEGPAYCFTSLEGKVSKEIE